MIDDNDDRTQMMMMMMIDDNDDGTQMMMMLSHDETGSWESF